MGEHTEITAKEWQIGRAEQDEIALASHQRAVAGWENGFFDDLVIPMGGVRRDTIPRKDTSLEKLARLPPTFDRTSGKGSLTAGNSSPLTDGAAAIWVASSKGLERLPSTTPRVKLVDWEIGSVDFRVEGLLMAPAFAIPRLLARHDLTYADIDLWEIHEAFAAQVAFHLKALQDARIPARQGQGAARFRRLSQGAPESQWRQHRHRPSVRRHRRPHHQPGREGARRHAKGSTRDRQHLRRRRPGQRHAAGGGMMSIDFLLTTLIIVVSPGTGVLFTLATGLSRGSRASVVAAFGCTLGIVPHMAAAILGLAALLHTSALAFQTFKYLGVAYLLYMAWMTLKEHGALKIEKEVGARSATQVIVSAILINILNPKLSIFFFAFLPQFVNAGEAQPAAAHVGAERRLHGADLRRLRRLRPVRRLDPQPRDLAAEGARPGCAAPSPAPSRCWAPSSPLPTADDERRGQGE